MLRLVAGNGEPAYALTSPLSSIPHVMPMIICGEPWRTVSSPASSPPSVGIPPGSGAGTMMSVLSPALSSTYDVSSSSRRTSASCGPCSPSSSARMVTARHASSSRSPSPSNSYAFRGFPEVMPVSNPISVSIPISVFISIAPMSLSSCVVSPVAPAVPCPPISYRISLPVPLVARQPVAASRCIRCGIRQVVASSHPIVPSSSPYRFSDSRAGRVGVDTDNRASSALSPVIGNLVGLYVHSRRGAWRLGTTVRESG